MGNGSPFPCEQRQWVCRGLRWEWGWWGREGTGSISGHQSHDEHFSLDSGSSYFWLGLSQLGLYQKPQPAEAEPSPGVREPWSNVAGWDQTPSVTKAEMQKGDTARCLCLHILRPLQILLGRKGGPLSLPSEPRVPELPELLWDEPQKGSAAQS